MGRDALFGVYLINSISTQPHADLTHIFRRTFLTTMSGAVFEQAERRLRE
jgi:hypothetical protein